MADLVSPAAAWMIEGQEVGWVAPQRPAWPLYLWGVRYLRAVFFAWRVARHQAVWARLGRPASGYDEWVLFGIMHGWC